MTRASSTPPGIAFARGACAQYGCNWGVDLSLWWGPIDGCVQNLNPSFHRRHLLIAHHAGAHTIAIEGVDILLGPNSTLSPLAAAIDEYELARARTHTRTHTHTHAHTRTPLMSTSLRGFTQAIQRNVSIADTDLSFSNSPAAPIPTPPLPSSSPPTKASSPRPTGRHNAAAKRGIMERCPRSWATVPWMEFLGFCGLLLPLRRSRSLGAHTPQMTPQRPHLL